MAHKIKSNPEGCPFGQPLYGSTCIECYYSQVKDNQWHGSEKCWNAQCLVYGGEDWEVDHAR